MEESQKRLAVFQGFPYDFQQWWDGKMVKVDLLIFDMDGTLCDTKDDIASAVNLTLKGLGLPEKPFHVIYGYVGSGVRKLLQQAVNEDSGERFNSAMRIFREYYMAHLLDTTKPYPGVVAVLDHFKGKKKAIVTNKPQEYTDRILTGLGLARYFDRIQGGDNGYPLKPDPGMLLAVLSSLGSDPKRTVMVGDGVHDIAAARAAGIQSCAVGYGLGDPEELRGSQPDFFCERSEDLRWLFE
jgi:phosphoglycolate phosphatase